MLVHVNLNTFPDECSRFFDRQFFKVRNGNFIKHLDAHVVPTVKVNAVFGQGIFGAVDGDGQNGNFHFMGDNEGARLERFYMPVFGSGMGDEYRRLGMGMSIGLIFCPIDRQVLLQLYRISWGNISIPKIKQGFRSKSKSLIL